MPEWLELWLWLVLELPELWASGQLVLEFATEPAVEKVQELALVWKLVLEPALASESALIQVLLLDLVPAALVTWPRRALALQLAVAQAPAPPPSVSGQILALELTLEQAWGLTRALVTGLPPPLALAGEWCQSMA